MTHHTKRPPCEKFRNKAGSAGKRITTASSATSLLLFDPAEEGNAPSGDAATDCSAESWNNCGCVFSFPVKTPVCSSPSLQKEALSYNELSKLCFSKKEALLVAYNASTAATKATPYSSPFYYSSSTDSKNDNSSSQRTACCENSEGTTEKTTDECLTAERGIDSGISPITPTSNPSELFNTKVIQRTFSRQGRANQRWLNISPDSPSANAGPIRLVTGCVPIMKNGQILLISSNRKPEWILPKGGWESDETIEESAIRETYEEAGVLGSLAFPRLPEVEYETRKGRKHRLEREKLLLKKRRERRGEEANNMSSCSSLSSLEDEQLGYCRQQRDIMLNSIKHELNPNGWKHVSHTSNYDDDTQTDSDESSLPFVPSGETCRPEGKRNRSSCRGIKP